jgi:hypothetical protein
MPRNVFEHHLENETCHGIQIARERLAPETERFKRNRSSAREWIYDQRCFVAVRRLDESAGNFQTALIRGEIRVGEIADELQQCFSQIEILMTRLSLNVAQQFASPVSEFIGAMLIAWIGKQQREQHCTACSKGFSRPPQMESSRMALPG